jgi:F0F1-type ATP synthase epsilon subunit
MQLHLISPTTSAEHTIAWIELPTYDGSIVIQRGHEPILLMLKPNHYIVFKLKTGKQAQLMVAQGVAAIDREVVTLLAEVTEATS